MPLGVVKWFSNQKGYGFIQVEGSQEDVFVHHTSIKMDGYKTLSPGDRVEFEVQQSEKGNKAINVSKAS